MSQKIELETSKLENWDKNPREISEENLEKLKRLMQKHPEFMEKNPLLVNKIGGKFVVYGGNQRLKAAKGLGLEKVWADLDENLSEKKMAELSVIDNIHFGEYVNSLLIKLNLEPEFLAEVNIILNNVSEEIIKNQKNWHFKISIINLNKEKAAKMEQFAPTPQERLEMIKDLRSLGIEHVTLRLRPFIIGYSNKDNEHLELIKKAKENGADSVSTEFFCLDLRADKRLRKRYQEMSKLIGFDVWNFYRINSGNSGYLRLTRSIKEPYIKEMKALCEKLGVRFYVSDAHFKECCSNGSCCGLPESFNYSRQQFTEALLIAKEKGKVRFSDIYKENLFDFKWQESCGYNCNSSQERAKNLNNTMFDFIRNNWNNLKSHNSPYKYFGGILKPAGLDNDNNVIYKYNE